MTKHSAALNPSPLGEKGKGEGAAPGLDLSDIRTVATLIPNPFSLREGEGAFVSASGGSDAP